MKFLKEEILPDSVKQQMAADEYKKYKNSSEGILDSMKKIEDIDSEEFKMEVYNLVSAWEAGK